MLMLIVMLMANQAAWAFDPPRIIGHLTASQPSPDDFATDFVCVGDQNRDGFDDLLVNHGTWFPRQGDHDFANRVELFYGGNPMDSIPDFVIAGEPRGPVGIGHHINFVGRITDSRSPFWAIQRIDTVDNGRNEIGSVLLYEAGESLDDEPEFVLRSGVGGGIMIGLGHRSKPFDVNGDSFSDLVTMRGFDHEVDEDKSSLQIYFGGNEFDTIPEVSFVLNSRTSSQSRFGQCNASVGYDVNSDGYDDVLFRYGDSRTDPRKLTYALFLGGDPMDTVAVWEFYEDRSADTFMNKGFAMVPDVNGDGFDDWVIHYWVDDEHHDPTFRQGYYLFFGGRHPDSEPDILLEGHPSCWGTDGEVIGGDVNGDGYGDIITSGRGGFQLDGSLNIHFGSRWINSNPDISINGYHEYGDLVENGFGWQLDGVGDYNDDGVDDIVVTGGIVDGPYGAIILGGRRDWHVSVPQESSSLQDYALTLDVLPNPFNSRVNITLTVPSRGNYKVEIFDINGRLVEELSDRRGRLLYGAEEQAFTWQAPTSGVYLVAVSSGKEVMAVRKVVCMP